MDSFCALVVLFSKFGLAIPKLGLLHLRFLHFLISTSWQSWWKISKKNRKFQSSWNVIWSWLWCSYHIRYESSHSKLFVCGWKWQIYSLFVCPYDINIMYTFSSYVGLKYDRMFWISLYQWSWWRNTNSLDYSNNNRILWTINLEDSYV